MQLFARDSLNFGHFVVEGKTLIKTRVRTALVEMVDKKVLETFSQELDSGGTFSLAHKIPAGAIEYDLEVYVSDPVFIEQKVEVISHLVAGDFFIVAGQSNAVCGWSHGGREHDSLYYSPFNRAIGGNFAWATEWYPDSTRTNYPIDEDCRFALPSSSLTADFYYSYSGIWPIQLQYELFKETGIPNCVVNGSSPGSSIFENLASHTPSQPNYLRHSAGPKNQPSAFIYDRLFKKLFDNSATKGVRGIFWYQGETDGTYDLDSSKNYDKRFHRLYTSWKADYPNLKKIFVMQLNTGCGGENLGLIREIQRKLPQTYEDVAVMSTVGNVLADRSPDQCHYTVSGYSRIADKLIPLVKKYVYDLPFSNEPIFPANIKRAYYINPKKICLEFDKDIIAEQACWYPLPDSGTVYLKDVFFGLKKSNIQISSVEASENKLFLNLLDGAERVEKITYLPEVYSKLPSLYSGPWILTKENPRLGAYSFFEFPVEPPAIEEIPLQEEEVLVFPNPGKDNFTIRFRQEGLHRITLFDVYGNMLTHFENTTLEIKVDASSLCSGAYILEISGETVQYRTKLIVL